MIDKRPAAIVRCAGPEDVAAVVRFAAEHDLPLSVRGGGHNVAGTALVDDGIVIDLSRMRDARIDPLRPDRARPGRRHLAGRRPRHRAARTRGSRRRRVRDRRCRACAQRRRLPPAPAGRDDGGQPRLGGGRPRRRPHRPRERRRTPRPLLGAPRRRRQLRRRDLLRASFAPARARGVRRQRRVPARGRRPRSRRVARRRRARARRAVHRRVHLVAPGGRGAPGGAARPAVRRDRRHVGGRPGGGRTRDAGCERSRRRSWT